MRRRKNEQMIGSDVQVYSYKKCNPIKVCICKSPVFKIMKLDNTKRATGYQETRGSRTGGHSSWGTSLTAVSSSALP